MSEVPTAPWMHDTLQQGLNFLNAGKVKEAEECARRVIGAKRDLPQAHFLVGLIALELDQKRPALQAFGSVTELDPTNCAAWVHVAKLFMLTGQHERAEEALSKAIKYDDGTPNSHELIGVVMSMFGDHEGARFWYKKATRKQPDSIGFRANHAQCLMYLGELEAAEEMVREALRIQPYFPNGHWLLSGLKKATTREHVDEMQEILSLGRLAPRDIAFLSYACGKELEDLEQWDEAFEAFAKGAAERRKTVNFDEQAEIAMYEALELNFTQEWLTQGSPGYDDASPIFILGQPRSGTTLVERVITAHSQLFSAGELRQFGNGLRRQARWRGESRFSAGLVEKAVSIDAEKLGKAYIATTRKIRGDTPHFVDKMPSNFLYLPLILKALPNAKIIHLRRDPMDACFSSFKQLFADAYLHSYEQKEMARHHARYYRLMSVWRERFGDRYHEVRYEDIASNLEPNARQLIDYLGIPWEDACLEFHKQKAAVTTASAVQVREPAHTKSIGRWRRYEDQLSPMRDVLGVQGVPTAGRSDCLRSRRVDDVR
jgi:tetratricopeptide (TPR) repeat protein